MGGSEPPDPGDKKSPESEADTGVKTGPKDVADTNRDPQPRGAGSITMDPLIGRVIAGRYEILQRIGSGGMGSVYRARQASVDRPVALKVLRPDLISNDHIRQRFRREAEIIARLSHPNTIRLYEFCTTEDGLAVMVMELLEGLPLSERLKNGSLGLIEGMQVGIEVARSLSEAHLLGLVHRDLKPANIFLHKVGDQQVSKVLDFGIARLMDEEATRLTVTDQVFGTPRYMSPEQGMSTANVDARSDLYSLGLILYECVVGQPPFVAQTSYQYLSAHSAQRPPKLRESVPTAPEALEQLIDACLEKRPEQRPQTAQVIADNLEKIRRALEFGTPLPAPISRPAAVGRPGQPQAETGPTSLQTRSPLELPTDGRRSKIAVLAFFALGAAAIAAVVAGLGSGPAQVVPDGGVAVDTGFAIAAPVAESLDSGFADAEIAENFELDASVPDSGIRKARRKRPRRRKRKKKDHNLVGQGAVTESRTMYIPTEDGSDDLLRAALRCKTSVFSGLSKLSTRGCPKDCAILLDAICAGRTPAAGREVPPGRRAVAIVCKGKINRVASLNFAENDVTYFRCR